MVQFFIVGLIDEIVLIHKSDPISTGTVNARIFGTVHTFVFLMDHPDPAVSFCNGITHGGTVIRGAIVHQNHFKIPESLVQNSVNAPIQIFFAFIHRYDDADLRTLLFCHASVPLLTFVFFRHMLLLLYIVFPPLKSAKNPRRQHKGICGDFQSGKPADSFSSE